MIVKAAVMILNLHTKKEMIIPCHRHCDAFYILKTFNMRRDIDYIELAQGFLDEEDNFYTRIEAYKHAYYNEQIDKMQNYKVKELFSEDLW